MYENPLASDGCAGSTPARGTNQSPQFLFIMRKNLPLFFLGTLIVACLFTCPLAAQTNIVADADALYALANQSASTDFAGQTIELQADIDLSNYDWKPIGTKTRPFQGTFHGNGHLITGLHRFDAAATDGVGLFGHVGQNAVIEKVGLNGIIVAKNKRRIGVIAGVCDGTIRQCWSMAQTAAAGNMVGGLVGELNSHGSITDCYNAGMILNANDTIGGIVGRNQGTLRRVYSSGYAKNGYAIVGLNQGGTYDDCYYDRKVYYQQPGVEHNEVMPVDVTTSMFSLFANSSVWSTASGRYPILSAFAASDAAKLSAAPMFIDTDWIDPINHANDLTRPFTVSTTGGIVWACQDESAKRWIQISGENVNVVRPCTETDVLVNVTLNGHTRVVYMRPRRLEDFAAGAFYGEKRHFCHNEEGNILSAFVTSTSASYGWTEGDYFYRVELYEIIGNDTVFVQALCDNLNAGAFTSWLTSYAIPATKAGTFVLRRFAHDEGCVADWIRSDDEFVYRVYEPFDAGAIQNRRDTLYLTTTPLPITISETTPATGGGGTLTYSWLLNGSALTGSNSASLIYPITEPGSYTFTRMVNDSAECGNSLSDGSYTVVIYYPFDPGTISESSVLSFCTRSAAQEYTLAATSATGGSGVYRYQWYTVNGTDTTAISGATQQNLTLGDIAPLAGQSVLFVRKAEDNTGLTHLTLSTGETTVHVMSELQPGAISDGALPNYCVAYDATGSTMITVSIAETTAATGDPGLEYQWVRLPDGAILATTKDLNYTFPLSEITIGTTYTYIRRVANPGCELVESQGKTTQYYGQGTREEVTVTICDGDLPYTMDWYDQSGNKQTHTFINDGDTWLVSDITGDCPADTLFTVHTVSVPAFKMDDEASLCQETKTMTLYYEQTAGLSDVFYIRYSADLAKYMGRPDTMGVITTPGAIVFNNMPNIGEGDCYLNVQIGYADQSESGTCFSRSHRMNLYVSLGGYVYSKYDRVVFVDNNPNNGALPGVTDKLEFVAYQWYKNGVKQDGQTGQYYHEDGRELNGVYYVMLTDTKGVRYRSCDVVLPKETASSAPQHSAVYPVPAAAGQPVTVEAEGTVLIRSFAGEIIQRAEQVNGSIVINAPYIAGIYYVQITAPDGSVEMHKLIVK